MTARPAASLLEAEPALIRMLGAAATAALGNRPILPVLTVPPGEWLPPARAVLGRETVALSVLDGWLLGRNGDRLLLGRGDRLDPWATKRSWTAATAVRLAVLGEELTNALADFPEVAVKLCALQRPRHPPHGHDSLEQRLADLLWCLARHWGTVKTQAIALPESVDASVLALFAAEEIDAIADALAGLRSRGTITGPRESTWFLHAADDDRREQLQARVAEQLAVSRMASAECAALMSELHARRRVCERQPRSSAAL